MSQDDSITEVTCTLTKEQEAERSAAVRSQLVARYTGSEADEDGLHIRFEGTDETLRAVARFTAAELQCCSFAEYGITVSPPYEETVLTVTGPAGTRRLFRDGLVERLAEASESNAKLL